MVELIVPLNLYFEQALWLENNPARANELLVYLQTSTHPQANAFAVGHLKRMMDDPSYLAFVQQYAVNFNGQPMWWENPTYMEPFGGIDFGDWAINYLLQYPTVSMTGFQQQFLPEPFIPVFDYSNLNSLPVLVNDDTVQMPVGFDFKFEGFNGTTGTPIRRIGRVLPRGNTEDTTYGTNGNVAGIMSNMPNFTDQQLFDEMEDLFHKLTTDNLETVGDLMIARFRNNVGGQFYNNALSQRVFEVAVLSNLSLNLVSGCMRHWQKPIGISTMWMKLRCRKHSGQYSIAGSIKLTGCKY